MTNGIRFNILIATKDRPKELLLLMKSITESTILPNKIVIVYSGADITSIIGSLQSTIRIEIIESEVASQVFQKSRGIENLISDSGWVLFLDDDVLLDKYAINTLLTKYIDKKEYTRYVGFGLAIKNLKHKNVTFLTKLILYTFGLYSFKPGRITKSGHPQSYLQQENNCDVNWLNGISLWRSEVLSQYATNSLPVEHSSYEDVLFSYKLGKTNKLLFMSDVFVTSQTEAANNLPNKRSFLFGSYLRYYFVDENREFSKSYLLVSQILRNLDFIFRRNRDASVILRIEIAFKVWFSLLTAVICKTKGEVLVQNKLIDLN